jgi:hypothetical protein
MSVTDTTTFPAASAAGSSRRRSMLRWITGGLLVATLLTAIAIAVWPASEADKAREDGKQFGEAVAQLQSASSAEEVDAALTEVHNAAADTADHAGDAVADQVNRQADALDRAANGFVGSQTTDDAFEYDLYQAELDVALDDLASNADDFRSTGPEVQQAFWDGYDQGIATSRP